MADRKRWSLLWSIVESALERSEGERRAFLEEHCGDDPALLREARELIENHPSSGFMPIAENDGPVVDEPSFSGERLDGRYELLRLIGRGGMGVVYEGRQLDLEMAVAVKLLFNQAGSQEGLEEARKLASLQHDHIVRILDVGLHRGHPYLVMEKLDGADLSRWIRYASDRDLFGRGPRVEHVAEWFETEVGAAPDGWPNERSYSALIAGLLREVTSAAQHAHRAGLIHHDITPKNVFVTRAGRAVLLDFGLAQHDEGERRLCGTPGFLAPELRLDNRTPPDARLDIHGLGATLYHLLTGQIPYDPRIGLTDERFGKLRPKSARSLCPYLPPDLDSICNRALEHDLAMRFADDAELAENLERFIERRPLTFVPMGRVRRTVRWSQRRPGMATMAAGLVLLSPLAPFAGISILETRAAERAERHWNAFVDRYVELPALPTLLADPRGALEASYLEPPAVSRLLDDLVDAEPELHLLRWYRAVNASRSDRLDVARADFARFAEAGLDTPLLRQLEAALTSPDADTRHKLVKPDDLATPESTFDQALTLYVRFIFRQPASAVDAADEVLTREPEWWMVRELRALAASEAEYEAETLYECARVREALGGRESGTCLHALAMRIRFNSPDEAIERWERALVQQPEQYLPYHMLAETQHALGLDEEALENAKIALTYRRDVPKAYGLLAKCYRGVGDFDAAGAVLREQIAGWPCVTDHNRTSRTELRNNLAFHDWSVIEDRYGFAEGFGKAKRREIPQELLDEAIELFRDYADSTPQESQGRIELDGMVVFLQFLGNRLEPEEAHQALRQLTSRYGVRGLRRSGADTRSPWLARFQLEVLAHLKPDAGTAALAWQCYLDAQEQADLRRASQRLAFPIPPPPH